MRSIRKPLGVWKVLRASSGSLGKTRRTSTRCDASIRSTFSSPKAFASRTRRQIENRRGRLVFILFARPPRHERFRIDSVAELGKIFSWEKTQNKFNEGECEAVLEPIRFGADAGLGACPSAFGGQRQDQRAHWGCL